LAKSPFLSLPWKILPDLSILSWIKSSGFHFFGFHSSFYRARASVLCRTPTWRSSSLYLYSPSDRVAPLHPQAPGSLFIAFYNSQGYDLTQTLPWVALTFSLLH
jgi:hypothetical protein